MSTPPSAAPVRVTPVPEELLHPALQPWSRVWRYLLAVLGGLVAWAPIAAEQLRVEAVPAGRGRSSSRGSRSTWCSAWCPSRCCRLRRRRPFLVACVTISLGCFSTASIGAATLAVVSMATWRRRNWVIVTAVAWFAAGSLSLFVYHARGVAPTDDNLYAQAGSTRCSASCSSASRS